jgi:hypothetical protein
MANTLYGFGLFLLAAAIVGGGLKAFGFELPVLKSTGRQITLAVLGIVLIGSAKWDKIQELIFPPRIVVVTDGPTTLEPGQEHKVPFSLTQSGRVEVVIESLIPDLNGSSEQKGMQVQYGLLVTIRSAQSEGPSPSRQMGVSEALSEILPPGSGMITVFNFATNPRMKVTLRISHQK